MKRHSMGVPSTIEEEGSNEKTPPTFSADTTKSLSKIAELKKAKSSLRRQDVFDAPSLEGTPPPPAPPTDHPPPVALTSYMPLDASNNNNNSNKARRGQRLGLSRQQEGGVPSKGQAPKLGLSWQPREEDRGLRGTATSTPRKGSLGTVLDGRKGVSGSDLLRPPTSDLSQRNSKSTSEIFVTRHHSSSSDGSKEGGVVFSPRRQSAGRGGASARPRLSRGSRVEGGGDSGKTMAVMSFDKEEHSESTL